MPLTQNDIVISPHDPKVVGYILYVMMVIGLNYKCKWLSGRTKNPPPLRIAHHAYAQRNGMSLTCSSQCDCLYSYKSSDFARNYKLFDGKNVLLVEFFVVSESALSRDMSSVIYSFGQ